MDKFFLMDFMKDFMKCQAKDEKPEARYESELMMANASGRQCVKSH